MHIRSTNVLQFAEMPGRLDLSTNHVGTEPNLALGGKSSIKLSTL